MSTAVNELSGQEMVEHLALTLTINLWEIHAQPEDWERDTIYAAMLHTANIRAGELGEHIAFGPPVLTELNHRAMLLTWPLAPEGKMLSPAVSCASERCTCLFHRAQYGTERQPTSALTWPEGW